MKILNGEANIIRISCSYNPVFVEKIKTVFEDLRRELVLRKYIYRTVKGYIYFNRDFLNFIKKNPYDVGDSDIKDYHLYLADEKLFVTTTLNQAINALKL